MFKQSKLYSFFESNPYTKLAQEHQQYYGSTLFKKTITLDSEQNAKNFFNEQIQQLNVKMAVISKLKDHLDANPNPTPINSISYYLTNMEIASYEISILDLAESAKNEFRKNVLFNPEKMIDSKASLSHHDFYEIYNKAIVTLSNPNHLDQYKQNRNILIKLTMAYKDNIDHLYKKFTHEIKEKTIALELMESSIAINHNKKF